MPNNIQRQFINIPAANVNIKPMQSGKELAARTFSNVASQTAGILLQIQKKSDSLAMSAFNSKIAENEVLYDNSLAMSGGLDEANSLAKKRQEEINSLAQKQLPKRLYDIWARDYKDNVYSEINGKAIKYGLLAQQKADTDNITSIINSSSAAVYNGTKTREDALNLIGQALSSAAGDDGSIKTINQEQRNKLTEYANNQLDFNEASSFVRKNPSAAIQEIKSGRFKSLTVEQISQLNTVASKQALEQEKDGLYNAAISSNTEKDGSVNYAGALKYVMDYKTNNIEGKKTVEDMINAEMNRNNAIIAQQKETDKTKILNNAYGLYLNGDVKNAITSILNSNLDGEDKSRIIENFKTNAGRGVPQNDVPEVYNKLRSGINSGSVYQTSQILKEWAAGKITDSTKNSLINSLGQRQQPSNDIYKSASKQLTDLFNRGGLFSSKTSADVQAEAMAQKDLSDKYELYLRQNKSVGEISQLFNPQLIQSIYDSYSPTLEETTRAKLQSLDKTRNTNAASATGSVLNDSIIKGLK